MTTRTVIRSEIEMMTRRRSRIPGPLGAAVVSAFLLGLVSGPLRACVSHPGHAAEQASAGDRRDHDTTHAPDDAGSHVGCECLGLCHLETQTPLPIAAPGAPAIEPDTNEAPGPGAHIGPRRGAPCGFPLARAPPALV